MEKDILLEKIIKKFDLYKGKKINYDEFMHMYQEYSDTIPIKEFVELLGIKWKSFLTIKSHSNHDKNVKIKVLINRELSQKDKILKLLEFVKKYNLNKGKKISYAFLEEMYDEVKATLTMVEFANLLGITNSNLKEAKRKNDKMRILRNNKLEDDKIENIRKNILKQYEGKKLYYESNENNKGEIDFLQLYRPYGLYFTEIEFANLLGVSEKNIWYTEHNMANPRIKDVEKIKKVESIKNEIEKMIYLKKDEIEIICQKLQITVDDFITYYINSGKCFDPSEYEKALYENNGLWIKKGKIEEKNIKLYNETFLRIARTNATNIRKVYGGKYNEDLQSDILLFILENCNDLVKNFSYDTKLMERMIWLRARQYAKIRYLTEKINQKKNVPFNDEKNYTINVYKENMVSKIENINGNQLLIMFQRYLDEGYNTEQILKQLSAKLKMEESEIFNKIKTHLLENGQEKQYDNSDYEIGE